MTSEEPEGLTAAAIARLAGVGRAAVSNWRKRYPDFPKPIGGSPTSPTFSRSEIVEWLRSTGKADQLATAGQTDTGSQRIADRADTGKPMPGTMLARVMASLLPRLTEDDLTDPDLDEHHALPVVLDPACADATLLSAVADRFGDRIALAGQDIDESATAAAAARLRQRTDSVPYEIRTGDSFLNDRFRPLLYAASAVVCEPPIDQPEWPMEELTTDPRWQFGVAAERDGELAWVQHCYAHLRPGGVAVLAVSPRTCVQPSGQSIRAELVRSGVLCAVIALPTGMNSTPGTDVFLWVLKRPSAEPDRSPVRMVDLTGLADAADVPAEFTAWQLFFESAEPSMCRPIARSELLDRGTSLLPADHVARVGATASDIAGVVDRLQSLYTRIGTGLPHFAAPPESPRYSYVTIAELERTGALTIRPRDTSPRDGDVLLQTLGRPPRVASATDPDISSIAQVVEVDPSRLDAHYLATFLRADAAALPVANTLGALSRNDLRRCRVPRLPLDEQRAYGDAFRRLDELQSAMSALASVGAKAFDQVVYGLTIGTLTPVQPRIVVAQDEMRKM